MATMATAGTTSTNLASTTELAAGAIQSRSGGVPPL